MEILNKYNLSEWNSQLIQNIIIELWKNGPMNRRQLVNNLGNPRTTIFDNLAKLQKMNVVSKFAKNNGARGRPIIYWKLNNIGEETD